MTVVGTIESFKGIEVGNAWDLRQLNAATNWIIGQSENTSESSLRFMTQSTPQVEGTKAVDFCVKWFVHNPGDPPHWGDAKPPSDGRTCSILASSGSFELLFTAVTDELKVILNKAGDFVVWGPGFGHSWKPLEQSTIITCRWKPL